MRHAALLAALLLTAGCLTPITEKLRAGDVEEPRWNVGDWWTYTVESDTIDLTGEVTIIVAEILSDGYILGIPADAEANAALLYHMPAIGPIGRDLSWDVHETRFEPIRWPLKNDESWDTTWINADVRLTARLNGTHWNINNSGHEQDAGTLYELTYDPEAKWFTSFTRTGLDGNIRQAITLTDRGTNYTGNLRAPQYIEIAFLDARTQGSTPGGLPNPPAAPNPTFLPPTGTDTMLVGCLTTGGNGGQYHAEIRAPGGGVVCNLDESYPPSQTPHGTRAQVVETDALEGDWEARLLAVGLGSATAEVLAWPTLNYTLGE